MPRRPAVDQPDRGEPGKLRCHRHACHRLPDLQHRDERLRPSPDAVSTPAARSSCRTSAGTVDFTAQRRYRSGQSIVDTFTGVAGRDVLPTLWMGSQTHRPAGPVSTADGHRQAPPPIHVSNAQTDVSRQPRSDAWLETLGAVNLTTNGNITLNNDIDRTFSTLVPATPTSTRPTRASRR
jgi:hypothetical protein